MIPGKNIYRYSRVAHFGNFPLYSDKPLWNYCVVFMPEIENISDNKNFFGVSFYFIKPLNKKLFSLCTGNFIRNSKVKVGSEVVGATLETVTMKVAE